MQQVILGEVIAMAASTIREVIRYYPDWRRGKFQLPLTSCAKRLLIPGYVSSARMLLGLRKNGGTMPQVLESGRTSSGNPTPSTSLMNVRLFWHRP